MLRKEEERDYKKKQNIWWIVEQKSPQARRKESFKSRDLQVRQSVLIEFPGIKLDDLLLFSLTIINQSRRLAERSNSRLNSASPNSTSVSGEARCKDLWAGILEKTFSKALRKRKLNHIVRQSDSRACGLRF